MCCLTWTGAWDNCASAGPADSTQTRITAPRELGFTPLESAKHGISAFFGDAVYIYSSPVRMGPRESLGLGAVLGSAAVLYANDVEVLAAFDRSRDGSKLYRGVMDVGETFEPLGFMGRTNLYWVSALTVGYALRIDVLRTIPAELLESHLIAGTFRQAGEKLVGRKRPFENQGPRSFGEGTSFPSGHASVIAEVATILSHHARHRAVSALCYGVAASVCLQRIDSHNHWPSDVFLGAAYGAYVARTVARRNEERRASEAMSLGTASSDRRAIAGALDLPPVPANEPRRLIVGPWIEGRIVGLQIRVPI